jgi:hypothetical protein
MPSKYHISALRASMVSPSAIKRLSRPKAEGGEELPNASNLKIKNPGTYLPCEMKFLGIRSSVVHWVWLISGVEICTIY